MNCKIGLFSLTLFVALIPMAASANLIANGDFETGDLQGWSVSHCDGCGVAPQYAHSGSYGFWGFRNGGFGTLSQSFATTVGDTYTFSFWTAANQTSNILEYQIGSGPLTSVPESTAYQQVSVSFTANSSSTQLFFDFATSPGSGVVMLDDVSVVDTAAAVPGPVVGAGFPGLIAAFGGLLAWRRRRANNQFAVA